MPVEVHTNGKVHYGLINHVSQDKVYLTPMPDAEGGMDNNPGVYAWGLGPAAWGGGFRRGFGAPGFGGGFGRGFGFPFSGISALYLLPFLFW